MARTAVSTSPNAVMTITGRSGSPSRSLSSSCSPSIPGILRSVRTRSGAKSAILPNALKASAADSTAYPSSRRSSRSAVRALTSSSTTRIRPLVSIERAAPVTCDALAVAAEVAIVTPEGATAGPGMTRRTSGSSAGHRRRRCDLRASPRRICAKSASGRGPSGGPVRHDDLEGCASLGGLEPDGPPVRLEDPPAEGQAEAAPLGLGGEERLEDPVSHLGWNSGAVVPHPQRRRLSLSPAVDPDVAAPVHRLAGVDEQVGHHPRQLIGIGVESEAGGHLDGDLDGGRQVGGRHRLGDELAGLDPPPVERAVPGQLQQI